MTDDGLWGFTRLDFIAVAWFAFCWIGYSACAEHPRWRDKSMPAEDEQVSVRVIEEDKDDGDANS